MELLLGGRGDSRIKGIKVPGMNSIEDGGVNVSFYSFLMMLLLEVGLSCRESL